MEDYGVAKGYLELDISSLESNVKSAVKYLDNLERQGALTESELSKLESQADRTGDAFHPFREVLRRSEEQAKRLAAQIEQSGKKIELYEAEIKSLNTIIENSRGRQTKLGTEVEKVSVKYEKSKQKVKEAAEAHGKEAEEYQKAVSASNKLKNELTQLQNQYDACGVEIEQSRAKVTEFRTAINNTQTSINRMSTELEQARSKAVQYGKAMQSAGDKLQSAGSKISGWGNALTVGATTPLLAAGTAAVKFATDSETSFAKVSTIADETVLAYDKIKEGVTSASNETGVAIADFNEALYQSISAGVDSGKAIGFTTDMVKLARGGFTDTSKAVDVVTSTLNAYGLSADQASSISDKLITTQNIGKTTVDELASSLGRIIPTAKAFGVDIDNVSTGMAILTKRGIQTAEATTYYNSMLNELGKSGTVADAALRELSGKGFQQLIAEGTPLTEILQMLSDKAAENGQTLADMFGSMEAGKAALSLMSDGGAEYNQVLEQMKNSAGATQKAFDKMNSTPAAKMQIELNKLKNAGIEAGEHLLPIVTDVVEEIGDLAEKFSDLSPEQQKAIVKTAAFVAAAGPAVRTVGSLTTGVGSLSKGFGSLLERMGKVGAAKTATEALTGTGQAAASAATSTGMLSKVLGAMATPGGIAVTAMTALTVGLFAAEEAEKQRIQTLSELTGKEKELADAIDAQYESYTTMAENRKSSLADINAEAAQTQNLANELMEIVDSNGRIKSGYEDRAAVIAGELSSALGQEISITNGVISNYSELNRTIEETIQKQKALAVSEAMSEDYAEAIRNRKSAQDEYNTALETQENWQNKISEAEDKVAAVREKYGNGANLSMAEMQKYNKELKAANDELEIAKGKYANASEATEKARTAMEGYNETIQNYEGLSSALLSGDADQINMALLKIEEGFLTAETSTRQSLASQRETIREEYEGMKEDLANGVPGVTQEAVDQMKALADQADAELIAKIDQDKQALIAKFQELGMDAPQSLINALEGKSPEAQASVLDMLEGMSNGTALKKEELKTMLKGLGIESSDSLISSLNGKKADVQVQAIDLLSQLQTAESSKRGEIISQLRELGINVDESLAEGIEGNKDSVTKSGSSVGEAGKDAMQDSFSGTNLTPPGVNGIAGTTYQLGTAGNTQMGQGLRVQSLNPPGVKDINSTSNSIGKTGNTQMGQGLRVKNLTPPGVKDLDVSGKASTARRSMQTYFDGNPLSVKVNAVIGKVSGAVKGLASMAGFANGGIATEPSIFGEAGPEMAIPLSSAKRERAKALYEQTGKLLGITAAESEIRRSALSNVSAASIAPENLTDSNVILNMPGLDYDLLAEKLAAKMSAVLRSNPIQPIIEMKDGDVLFETERVGRKLAPVISRVQAQNT